MPRFAVNLIVASGMNVTVTSGATFSIDDRTTIVQNSGAGMWPFYTSSSDGGASTEVTFDDGGSMTVRISSLPDIPMVIGCSVLPVAQFLGHASITTAPQMAMGRR
jgi:hypothetical protein